MVGRTGGGFRTIGGKPWHSVVTQGTRQRHCKEIYISGSNLMQAPKGGIYVMMRASRYILRDRGAGVSGLLQCFRRPRRVQSGTDRRPNQSSARTEDDPVSWTPEHFCSRSPQWQRRDHLTLLSSVARWSSWCAPGRSACLLLPVHLLAWKLRPKAPTRVSECLKGIKSEHLNFP